MILDDFCLGRYCISHTTYIFAFELNIRHTSLALNTDTRMDWIHGLDWYDRVRIVSYIVYS